MENKKRKWKLKFALMLASMFAFGAAGVAAMTLGSASNNAEYQTVKATDIETVTLNLKEGDDVTVGSAHAHAQSNWSADNGAYIFVNNNYLFVETTDDSRVILNAVATVSEYDWCAYAASSSAGTVTYTIGGNYNTFITIDNINVKSFYLRSSSSFYVSQVVVETGITYPVTFNTNGGTIKAGNMSMYVKGFGATLPTNIVKEGYIFDGWYANSGLSGDPVTSISSSESGAKTYYAKWISLSDFEAQKGIAISGYEQFFDRQPHGISITGSLDDYTIKYSNDGVNYNLDECPTYTDVSSHDVYFKLSKDGQRDIYGVENVHILDVYYMVGDFSGGERLDDYLLTQKGVLLSLTD